MINEAFIKMQWRLLVMEPVWYEKPNVWTQKVMILAGWVMDWLK